MSLLFYDFNNSNQRLLLNSKKPRQNHSYILMSWAGGIRSETQGEIENESSLSHDY
jgi:hypothetical protein